MFLLLVLCLAFNSGISFSKSLHSEVSLGIDQDVARKLIDLLKLEPSTRVDRYFDYYSNGQFYNLSSGTGHKLRIMSGDSKPVKFQASSFQRVDAFMCDGQSLTVNTKLNREINYDQSSLGEMAKIHDSILNSLIQGNREMLESFENKLAQISRNFVINPFKKNDFQNSVDRPKSGILTSVYSSRKRNYRRIVSQENGQKIEVSVTEAKNFISESISKNEISIEFEMIGDHSHEGFSKNVCKMIKKFSIPIKEGRSSSPIIWQKSLELNNSIRGLTDFE